MEQKTTINDVLSGNAPIKTEITISAQSIMYLGICFVLVIAVAAFVLKKPKTI